MNRIVKFSALGAVSALVLSACTNPDGTYNRTQTGAAIGALTGAAIGIEASDNDKKGALLGAAAGAAAGAGIGNVLDRQEAALRQQLGNSGVGITNTGQQLVVNLPESITFATDSSTVAPAFENTIAQLAQNLQQYPNSTISVIGHTDSTGEASYNQALSERRANAVAGKLMGYGVSAARISAYGQGEASPIASNDTAAGRQQNRRVEVVIRPTQ
ncbi:OmpA family protein [Paracoccaceae bacterium GXU_MW_L88]